MKLHLKTTRHTSVTVLLYPKKGIIILVSSIEAAKEKFPSPKIIRNERQVW